MLLDKAGTIVPMRTLHRDLRLFSCPAFRQVSCQPPHHVQVDHRVGLLEWGQRLSSFFDWGRSLTVFVDLFQKGIDCFD